MSWELYLSPSGLISDCVLEFSIAQPSSSLSEPFLAVNGLLGPTVTIKTTTTTKEQTQFLIWNGTLLNYNQGTSDDMFSVWRW